MPPRGPPCCGFSRNSYYICRFQSNHCYPCWMCSAWAGSEYALDDPRPSILQLNTKVLTANKIFVIEQL